MHGCGRATATPVTTASTKNVRYVHTCARVCVCVYRIIMYIESLKRNRVPKALRRASTRARVAKQSDSRSHDHASLVRARARACTLTGRPSPHPSAVAGRVRNHRPILWRTRCAFIVVGAIGARAPAQLVQYIICERRACVCVCVIFGNTIMPRSRSLAGSSFYTQYTRARARR